MFALSGWQHARTGALQYIAREPLAETGGESCYREERHRNGGVLASSCLDREKAPDDGEVDHGAEYRSDNRSQRSQSNLLLLRRGEIDHQWGLGLGCHALRDADDRTGRSTDDRSRERSGRSGLTELARPVVHSSPSGDCQGGNSYERAQPDPFEVLETGLPLDHLFH